MKKLIAIALLAASFTVSASPEDWITNSAETGSSYVVLPASAGIGKSGKEWFALVNELSATGAFVARHRVHVDGCPSAQRGRVIWVTLPDNTKTEELAWDRDGDRVYELVAYNVCKAAYVKGLFELEGKKPAKKGQPTV